MAAGDWGSVRLPAPDGPAVSEHMETIRAAAYEARAANRAEIRGAIEACLQGKCLQRADRPGRPPPEDSHGSYVLLALVHALNAEWEKCLATLHHGQQPDQPKKQPDQAKKPKS